MTNPRRSPFPNTFRQRIRTRDTLVGCWLSLPVPHTAEVLGHAGFDWLMLDAEHSTAEPRDLAAQLLALGDSTSAAVTRPPANDPVMIKRLLDAGFQNLLIPFVEDAEQATQAVRATRYPPYGVRGVSASSRANQFGQVADYFAQANDNICVLVQLETANALERLDEIAQVDGVDGLFIGPSDLSASMGHIGQPGHPDVQKAIRRALDGIRRHGKGAGILAPVLDDARRYLDMGATFVAAATDIGLLKAGAQHVNTALRQPS